MAWPTPGTGGTGATLVGGMVACWMAVATVPTGEAAEESRFAMAYSRSQYVHWIDLYDAAGNRIDPADPDAPPYSPVHTCGRCHDYEAIAHGYHFNAMQKLTEAGRPGEPWIWTDTRTGTQIPLSYRGWPGTYDPRDLGIQSWDFVLKFGRHLPGGGPGDPASAAKTVVAAEDAEGAGDVSARDQEATGTPGAEDTSCWPVAGSLAVDCMLCHSRDTGYSMESWWEQITKQNFAWAPAVALGLASADGDVSKLPKDFDPSARPETGEDGEPIRSGPSLPKTTYHPARTNASGKIFFDVVLRPSNDTCYYCHTTRVVGEGEAPAWTHDEDVHLRAGMSCVDCHRNDLGHHTVRGYEGESHPTGLNVASLSCRGCHMEAPDESLQLTGGRMGAPKPLHRGLPPIHLERLSCTACHSGPRPGDQAFQVQTAMAHALGLPTHHLGADTEPGLVAPVMIREGEMLYPHRMVWPAFWGQIHDSKITPLNPETVNGALRRVLRVRGSSTFTETLTQVVLSADDKKQLLGEERASVPDAELTDAERQKLSDLRQQKGVEAFQEKLVESLTELKKIITQTGAEPVYVAGGRAYRLGSDGKAEPFTHPAAEPYAWKLAHDVRPARWSSGATGCFECHSDGAPIFDGQVTALGPAPDMAPPAKTMTQWAGYNPTQIKAWNQSFQGRTAFKWFGFASVGVVALVLVAFFFLGVNGLVGLVRRA